MLLLATAAASPWTPARAEVRAALGVQLLSTRRSFASPEAAGRVGPRCPDGVRAGQRIPYDCTTGGRFSTVTAPIDLAIGLGSGVALDAYVPVVLHARFEDDLGGTTARGLGDLRFGFRAGRVYGAWAVALTAHLKAPTGPAGLVDRDVPLGEAQWDGIPGVRVGRSLGPAWLETHQSLVWRFRSGRSGIDPGEEWSGALGGGASAGPIGLQLRAEWLLAAADTDRFGLSHPGRSMLQLRSGPFVRRGDLWAEVGVVVPLAGKRWPSSVSVGASVAWQASVSRRADSARRPDAARDE